MEGEEMKGIKEKINFFYNNKIKVHIKKKDGFFYNGLIFSKVKEDVWFLREDILGDTYLFLNEIVDISQFIEKEVKK